MPRGCSIDRQAGVVMIDISSHSHRKLNGMHFSDSKEERTNLGNLSASKTTVSMPSRARQEAAYEPAGPPPITSTEV